ncbi:MAG TPA: hypothetical protein VFE19_08275 [Jatrophihabitantaceae bacterium]|jgi:hypothetical protein|nr:hypothetical protein [Jatrophihabitantaceae bacterium]
MPGLDHQSDRPGDAGSEELLGAERRPLPRWAVLACVAVAAVAAITVTQNNSASHKQLVTPSPSPTLFPSFPALHRAPVGLDVDSAVGAPVLAGPTLDVALAGDTSWVLQPHALVMIVRNRAEHTVRIPGPSLARSSAKLVLDVPTGVLWIVERGVSHGRVLEYDVVRLRLMRHWQPVAVISDAAALDGQLFLTSGDQLFDVATGRPPVTAASVQTILGGVIADPARHRLLMYGSGANTQVWPITLTAQGRSVVGHPAVVALSKATVGVAQGSVWIGGFAVDRPVLTRLDPRTLQPTTESPIDAALQPGAVIVASGVVVIWVRDSGGARLRCIDAVTGVQLQAWMINGAVASGGAHGLVATTYGAVPLELSACSG